MSEFKCAFTKSWISCRKKVLPPVIPLFPCDFVILFRLTAPELCSSNDSFHICCHHCSTFILNVSLWDDMFGYCNPLQPCTLRYKCLSAFNRRSIAYVRVKVGIENIDKRYLFIYWNVLKNPWVMENIYTGSPNSITKSFRCLDEWTINLFNNKPPSPHRW